MTAFEDRMVGVVVSLLSKYGFSAAMVNPSATALNRDTLEVTQTGPSVDILAAFFDPTTSSLSGYERSLGTDYIKSKKWVIVQSDVQVETGAVITTPHGTFTVNMATDVGPSNPIYYRVAADQTA